MANVHYFDTGKLREQPRDYPNNKLVLNRTESADLIAITDLWFPNIG